MLDLTEEKSEQVLDFRVARHDVLHTIIDAAVGATRIRHDDLMGSQKTKGLSYIRFAIIYLLYVRVPQQLPIKKFGVKEIGRHLGGRDHSTISNGLRQAQTLLQKRDPKFTTLLQSIAVLATFKLRRIDEVRKRSK